MSAGRAHPFDAVAPIAVELQRLLEPACERIAIAGSLRRRRAQVRDIELVAIPKVDVAAIDGLFAEHADLVEHNRLRELLDRLRADGTLPARDVEVHRASGKVEVQQRLGERFMALAYRGVPVDLFLATAENWGCVLALRTGPYDWNVELVTQCHKKLFRRVEGTRVLDVRDQVVPTPTEEAFFAALGQPWVEPRDRHPSRVRIERLAEVPA